MDDRRTRLSEARLYLVCEAMPDAFLDAVLRGGVDMIQLRIKHGSDEDILAAAKRFRSACDEHEALFILNDRPELVEQAGADGVHVGQDDLPVTEARELVGSERLIGLSTHSPEQVEQAAGVDYIGVGPVHATPTKPGRPAVGLELVRYASQRARVPWFAIGGIEPSNAALLRAAGAERIAVVRALTGAEDPESIARQLRGGVRVGAT